MYMMHWQNRQSATSDQTRLRPTSQCRRAGARAKFFAKIHGTEASFVRARRRSRVPRGRFLFYLQIAFIFLRIVR